MFADGNCTLVVEDAAVMAGEIRTEIDLKDRVIRRTWKLMGFARSRTYGLDDHMAVEIRDNSTTLEGYCISSFVVYLAGRGGKIRISLTDDLKEALRIWKEIAEFLREAAC
jgi:hypothetical protein